MNKIDKAMENHQRLSVNIPDVGVLKGSLLAFIKYFYKLRTGAEFLIRPGENRVSFVETLIPVLEGIINHDPKYLRTIIRCPPRYGKTELVLHAIAWGHLKFPRSISMYISYNSTIAKKNVKTLKRIMSLPEYQVMSGLRIMNDSRALSDFSFNTGGGVLCSGRDGTVLGTGAGLFGSEDFGGLAVMDDVEKASDVTSEKYRIDSEEFYKGTLSHRLNNAKTPVLGIGQLIHADDLLQKLLVGKNEGNVKKVTKIDIHDWTPVVLPALDSAGNALMPAKHTKETLLKMLEITPYETGLNYLQEPVPPGGGLFQAEYFYPLTDEIPDNIEATFVTGDTAETDKSYNDPTVFSFWGIYKHKINGQETDKYCLHWIDCIQIWIEPKDLEREFLSFYSSCMRFHVKPSLVAIEKKSTGVTLLSTLKQVPGLRVIEIERTRASGSKSTRFIEMQYYISQKMITLHNLGKHSSMCIEHMTKITANDTHRYDDICDTAYDAIKMALIDETVIKLLKTKDCRKITGYKAHGTKKFGTWNSSQKSI